MGTNNSPLFQFDKKIVRRIRRRVENFCLVGIDEAGRGPWAGPVVASAVILPPDFFHPLLNDSKKLTPQLRLQLYQKLKKSSLWAIGVSPVPIIDSCNILQATFLAMKTALNKLLHKNPNITPDLVLIDGPHAPNLGFPQKAIVKGDSQSASIAAASVIAKVSRDQIMRKLDQTYPQYGFAQHKGYGTELHRKNLLKFGPALIHRKSFLPIKKLWNKSENAA